MVPVIADRKTAKREGLYTAGTVVQLREGIEGPDQRVGHVERTCLSLRGYYVRHGRHGEGPFGWGPSEVERVGWRRALVYRVTGR